MAILDAALSLRMRIPASRHILRILGIFLLAGMLVALAAFWLIQKNAGAIAGLFLDELNKSTGLVFSVEGVELRFRPAPGLSLTGMAVEGPGFSCQTRFAVFRPKLMALLDGRIEPARIFLAGPRLSLDMGGGGEDSQNASTAENASGASGLGDLRALLAPAAQFIAAHVPQDFRMRIVDGVADIALADGHRLKIGKFRADLLSPASGCLSGTSAAATVSFDSGEDGLFRVDNAQLDMQADLANPVYGDGSFYASGDLDAPGRGSFPGLRFSLQTSDKGWDMQPYINGHIRLGREEIPLHFSSRMSLAPGSGRLDVRNGQWQLDADSGSLDFSALLPASLRASLASLAGQGASSTPASDSWNAEGNFFFHRLSLVQWLGFGRMLNPGLQQSLDNITNGKIHFRVNEKGLEAPVVEASCTRARFYGKGGVESWEKPVVDLEMRTDRANLLLAIPESGASGALAPSYFFAPLTPVPDSPWRPGETLIGYDIRIGAERVDYGPVHFENALVRVSPGSLDASGERPVIIAAQGAFYGGSVSGKCVLGTGPELPYDISASVDKVSAAPLAADLDLVPMKSGKLSGTVDLKSRGRELAVFLDSLHGSAAITGQAGEWRLPGQKKGLPYSGMNLGLALKKAFFRKGRLGLDGKWTGAMKGTGYSLGLQQAGALLFGPPDMLAFSRLPATFRLRLEPALTGLGKAVPVSGSCSATLGPAMKLHLEKCHLDSAGAVFDGDAELGVKNGAPEAAGSLQLACPNLGASFAALGLPSAALPESFRRLELSGRYAVSPGIVQLSEMKFGLGKVGGEGGLTCNFSRERPQLDFDLLADTLDLTPLIKAPPRNRAPYDFSFLRAFDASGTIEIRKFIASGIRAGAVRLPLALRDGQCLIAPIAARFYDANLHGESKLVFNRNLIFDNRLEVRKFNLKKLMADLLPEQRLGGMATLLGHVSGSVTGPGQIPAALMGEWSFSVDNGYWQSVKNGKAQGKQTNFSSASASGSLERGVLNSKNFILHGDGMTISGGGWINLDRQTLDCNFSVNMSNTPDIPLRLYGSLLDSKRSIGAGRLILNAIGGIATGFVDALGAMARGATSIFH